MRPGYKRHDTRVHDPQVIHPIDLQARIDHPAQLQRHHGRRAAGVELGAQVLPDCIQQPSLFFLGRLVRSSPDPRPCRPRLEGSHLWSGDEAGVEFECRDEEGAVDRVGAVPRVDCYG